MAKGYATGQADMACALTVFHGRLYCTQKYRTGVYCYEGGTEWSLAGLVDQRIVSLTVYRDHLYALINGSPVYRYEGGDIWTNCGTTPDSTQTYCSVIHQGKLHVGTWPSGEVWRYEGGTEWVTTSRTGYEMEVMGGAQYNGKAYWGTLPMANVYRMENDWMALVSNLGQAMVALRRIWSMATYEGCSRVHYQADRFRHSRLEKSRRGTRHFHRDGDMSPRSKRADYLKPIWMAH